MCGLSQCSVGLLFLMVQLNLSLFGSVFICATNEAKSHQQSPWAFLSSLTASFFVFYDNGKPSSRLFSSASKHPEPICLPKNDLLICQIAPRLLSTCSPTKAFHIEREHSCCLRFRLTFVPRGLFSRRWMVRARSEIWIRFWLFTAGNKTKSANNELFIDEKLFLFPSNIVLLFFSE